MIRLRFCKNFRAFPVLLFTFVLLAFGCATNRHNSQNNITGNWKWTLREGNTTVKGTSHFYNDGNLRHNGSIVVRIGDKMAVYDFRDSLKWKIENNYLIELPESMPQFFNFRGDPEAVEAAQNNIRRDEVKEIKSKILHLSKDNCVLLIDHGNNTLELILSRID